MKFKFLSLVVFGLTLMTGLAKADVPPPITAGVAGTYKAVLQHDGEKFYQYAYVTFRTIQTGGEFKIGANVRIFFGGWDSNEFLTYDYDYRTFNPVLGQVSLQNEKADVSLVGVLRGSTFSGQWYSSLVGRVGAFTASKGTEPKAPADSTLVKTFSGQYRGTITNTSPQSSLPERVTFSFVTTQVTSGPEAGIKITGSTRLYLGEFDSLEYVELKFTDIQFNFFNRYLTAKTTDYGLTFKGTMTPDGVFDGVVFADGVGEAGKAHVTHYP